MDRWWRLVLVLVLDVEVHLVCGAFLKVDDFVARANGDVRGTIVGVVGGLIGTRTGSALIVRPDNDWPMGGLAGCLPFSSRWYRAQLLDGVKGNRLLSSRKLIQDTCSPWGWDAKTWFPERDKTGAIGSTEIDRVAVDFAEVVSLRDEGIEPGDRLVLYAIDAGLEVAVPDTYVWRAE